MEEVRNWLRKFGLEEYSPALESNGWDTLEVVEHMTEDDIGNCINKPGHVKRLLLALREKLNKTAFEKDEVIKWLKCTGLEDYKPNFIDGGWDTLEVICHMTDREIEKCIDKPGHRKRFKLDIEVLQANIDVCSQNITQFAENVCINKSSETIETWLRRFNLDQYTSEFNREGWDTLAVIFEMVEEDIKNCISLPGHRKRLHLALDQSKDDDNTTSDEPITFLTPDEPVPLVDNNPELETDQNVYGDQKDQRKFAKLTLPPFTTQNGNETLRKDVQSFASDSSVPDILEMTSISFTFDAESENSTQGSDTKTDNQVDSNILGDSQGLTQTDAEGFSTVLTDAIKSAVSMTTKSVQRQESVDRIISSPPIIQSTTIYKPTHCSVAGTVEKYKLTQESDRQRRQNYKAQMQSSLKSRKEKDSLYVETRALYELEHIVDDRYWGIIIGVPGDGKSAMAAHLSLKYNQKGYRHLELHCAKEWKEWVDGTSGKGKGKKQFVTIDDIFGQMSVDERQVSEWLSIFELMQRVVKQREGDLIVVCTSRTYVYMDVKSKLTKFTAFRESSIVDMTQTRFALTITEKTDIWQNYSNKYDVRTEIPECVSQTSQPPHGFPHCVELYATNHVLQKEGPSFFENPMKYVCREIENFIQNDRVKYCGLLFVLFNNNKLPKDFLEQLSQCLDKTDRIREAAGLPTIPAKVDLKGAFKGLKNTYIIERDKCYSFSHNSIRENLAYIFIRENPTVALEDLDFRYLKDHTKIQEPDKEEKKSGPDSDGEKTVYTLPIENTDTLIKRMVREIRNGNIVTVCAHQAWTNVTFVDKFLQSLFKLFKEKDEPRCIADILTTKDSTTCDFDLLESLRFFGHHDAVNKILECKDLFKHIQDVVEIPTTLKCIEKFSRLLYSLMDHIGASKKARKFQQKSAVCMEILDSLSSRLANQPLSCYIFGSHSEGTRISIKTKKLESDVNYVFCDETYTIIQDISEVNAKKPQLLTITDEETKPGYVKLQLVENGIPQTAASLVKQLPKETVLDNKGRVVIHRRRPEKIFVDEQAGSNATTDMITGNPFDIYESLSYRCYKWPEFAKGWLDRPRHYNWPSRYDIERMKSMGYFLVPNGCRESAEKHLEWKLSFCEQERLLMKRLNETQYKCYIALKMINSDIISRLVQGPSLTSYHLKTCMFYLIESTPKETWRPDNLLECVQGCLKSLLKWIIDGKCPNYFNPEENMFKGRIHGELQTNLRSTVQDLLRSDFRYILYVVCGDLGQGFGHEITRYIINDTDLPSYAEMVTAKLKHVLAPDICKLNVKAVSFISLVKNRLLYKCCQQALRGCSEAIRDMLVYLRQTSTITSHDAKETKRAISQVMPYIEISFMSSVVATELSAGGQEMEKILFSTKWSEMSSLSNLFSAKLKQATFLFVQGHFRASLQILDTMKSSLGPRVTSVCGCSGSHHYAVDVHVKQELQNKSGAEIRGKYSIPCIEFLPKERYIIPVALAYEMDRKDMCGDPNNEPYHFWFDWAVVDGKILFHFLMYLNHSKLEKQSEAAADIENLKCVLDTDSNLGHKETGYNLIGWIYAQEGQEILSQECFQKSISIRRLFNAAYIHGKETK